MKRKRTLKNDAVPSTFNSKELKVNLYFYSVIYNSYVVMLSL